MRPDDLTDLVTKRARQIDLDRAWEEIRSSTENRRRRGRLLVVLPSIVVLVLIGTVIVRLTGDDDPGQRLRVGNGPSSTQPATTGSSTTAPPTTQAPQTSSPANKNWNRVPLHERPNRAPRDPGSGNYLVPWTFLGGRRLTVVMTQEVRSLLAPLFLSNRVSAICQPDCGYGDIAAVEADTPDIAVETELPAADGGTMLVATTNFPALVWRREHWVVQIGRFNIPEDAYPKWAGSIRVKIDEEGWLYIDSEFTSSNKAYHSDLFPAHPPDPVNSLDSVTLSDLSKATTYNSTGPRGKITCPPEQPTAKPFPGGRWIIERCITLPDGPVSLQAIGTEAAVMAIDQGLQFQNP